MSFNAKKCHILTITKEASPNPFFYQLCNTTLSEVSSCTYLGVMLQNDMKFDEHIDSITNRANRTLGFCQRNLKHAPADLKELSYYSLVRSLMEYAAPVWDPYLSKHKKQLEAIQRAAAHYVKSDYSSYSSVTSMLNELEWLSLEERRRVARLVLSYKITNDVVGVPSSDFLTWSDSRTRNSKLTYKHYSAKTEQYRHSYFPRSVPEWKYRALSGI